MNIIDAHMHFSDITAFKACAEYTSEIDYSEAGYINETAESGVIRSVCMGLAETSPAAFPDKNAATPMLANLSENLPGGVSVCLGVNPHTLDKKTVGAMEGLLKTDIKKIAGIKLYAGYYHYYVYDSVYDPVYRLALEYDLPVAIHAGETYTERGLLEYAHPLRIDRLAVKYPDLKIVICHMGAPWVFDACETAGKNRNVYVDLSGLLVKNAAYIDDAKRNRLITDRYMQPLVLMDNYEKVIYGSDWPLAPMREYIEFCKILVPPDAYPYVFYENASKVYNLPD